MSTTEVTPSSREMTTRWRMMGSKVARSFCFGFLIVTVVVFLSETAKVPSALFRSAEAPRARPPSAVPLVVHDEESGAEGGRDALEGGDALGGIAVLVLISSAD